MSAAIVEFTLADLLKTEILENPYPVFRELREHVPVHWDASAARWIVTRYEDVSFVLKDQRFSAARLIGDGDAPVGMLLSRQMLFMDPPDHTRLRSLFARAFTPGRMQSLQPEIERIVTDLLDKAQLFDGAFDFVPEIAIPLPVIVIAQMLGVPVDDRYLMRGWSVAFGKLISGRTLSEEESREAFDGVMAFAAYFRELIERRRKQPADDMLTDLIAAEESGDRLSTQELIANLILLLAAGHGTTTHLLSNGLYALMQHPDQWRALGSDPAIAPSAVSELLRFDGPVQSTSREALEAVRIGETTVPAGAAVTVLLGSANRDERLYDQPDRLNLRRTGPRMLSFGHGVHACLGAALARMETQIAFAELARRFPGCSLVSAPVRIPSVTFRGLQSLRIRV